MIWYIVNSCWRYGDYPFDGYSPSQASSLFAHSQVYLRKGECVNKQKWLNLHKYINSLNNENISEAGNDG